MALRRLARSVEDSKCSVHLGRYRIRCRFPGILFDTPGLSSWIAHKPSITLREVPRRFAASYIAVTGLGSLRLRRTTLYFDKQAVPDAQEQEIQKQ